MSTKVLKEIRMKLDPASIDNAIKELEQFESDLETAVSEMISELTEFGCDVAKVYCVNAPVDFFDDWEDIPEKIQWVFFPDEKAGYIYSDNPKAVFMEYGTGIVGGSKPHAGIVAGVSHPQTEKYTKYDTNEHGKEGWTFIRTDGKLVHTIGSLPGQFMYDTLLQLRDAAPEFMSSKLGMG